jgi:hypothetical protein
MGDRNSNSNAADGRKVTRIGSSISRKVYVFLKDREEQKTTFQYGELLAESGWARGTLDQYLSTRLRQFIRQTDFGYEAMGCLNITADEFCRLVSQSVKVARDPLKPSLPLKSEALLTKARDAALGGVQHYNNPTAVFRSGNYIVLMFIAYTALFHAIFERDGVDYKEYGSTGQPKNMADGKGMLWDAIRSARYYQSKYAMGASDSALTCIVKNLEFLKPIRDVIEHRDYPELDTSICGHCQSLLLNFETILVREFTQYYSLNSSLTLALQFSNVRSQPTVDALRRFHSEEYGELKAYIQEFQTALPDDVLGDPAFAFRVWLIQKPARDARSSDMAMEFIRLDELNAEQRAEIEEHIVAIKRVVRETKNSNNLLPKDVAEQVEAAIGKTFNASYHHAKAWRHYKVRPPDGASDVLATNAKYCVYDTTFRRYIFTQEWVGFLIKELSNEKQYALVCGKRASS